MIEAGECCVAQLLYHACKICLILIDNSLQARAEKGSEAIGNKESSNKKLELPQMSVKL